MIKVSVRYPNLPGARFDHDYYRDRHMPLVQGLLGESCLSYTVDRGLSAATAGSAPAYVAMCHIFSPSVDVYAAGMERGGAQILADITNYTDLVPVIQVSEVVVEREPDLGSDQPGKHPQP